MKVTAIVPTRIDLAGGTLDVYPLYSFTEQPNPLVGIARQQNIADIKVGRYQLGLKTVDEISHF